MSRFDEIETDFGLIVGELVAEFEKNGKSIKDLENSEFSSLVFDRLFDRYLSSGKYDQIIDYYTDQHIGVDGDQYYIPLGQKLLECGDKLRFIKLWRAVIAVRKRATFSDAHAWGTIREAGGGPKEVDITQCYGYEETLSAMKRMLDGLEQLGESRLYEELKQDMELFREGKKRKLSKPQSRQMDESLFWQLIEEAKNNSISAMERPGQLTSLLENYSATSIKKFSSIFQNRLDQLYRQDVWAIAYIALGGCSDDGFEYFRCWLISEGKSIFDAAIDNPESLVDLVEQPLELEAMLYATDEAYERRANKVLPARSSAKRVKLAGKEWTEEELPKLFPKACKKYGWAL